MKRKNEFKVGIFTVIILVTIYVSITFLKGTNIFSFNNNSYYVIYDKGGSNTGDGVTINGIKVGSVTKTEFLKKELRIRVDFEVEKGIILTDKTIAILNGSGFFPGRYKIDLINIEAEGNPLPSGSEVKGTINQSLTEELMSRSAPIVDDIKSASALISDLATILAKNQLRINSAIANLELLTSTFKDYILENKSSFNEITKNITKIITSFADERNGLSSLVSNFNITLKKLNQINIKEVNTSIREFRKLITKTQQRGNTLGEILYNDELYKNINKVTLNLNELLLNVKAQPGRYFHFSVFGKKAIRRGG